MTNPLILSLERDLKNLRSGGERYTISTPTPDQIRARREKLGLSQEKFAQRIGVSVESVRSWESGRRIPGEVNVEKMSTLEKV